ncbi:Phosphatidylserine lipase ABHD16A [Halotydeus destructor]|nr:Phosphatidylserine lipase ABHD16A [Halotydeus destructor]
MDFGQLVACITGPRLYRINRQAGVPGQKYSGSTTETVGDNAIRLIQFACSFGLYSVPVVIPILYARGTFTMSNNSGPIAAILRLAAAVATIIGGSYLLRGLGRLRNAEYLSFLNTYSQIKQLTPEQIRSKKEQLLSKYDFDFNAWPTEYRWSESTFEPKNTPLPLQQLQSATDMFSLITKLPCDILAYVAVHSFGRRMMYPGSVYLLQKAVEPMLIEGRIRLIEKYSGERFKLETSDSNYIDSVFVDRRRSSSEHGRKLVVCSEGNAGFYEIGIMATPLECGYSVLGWNAPGFAASTGLPFPTSVVAAMDTVMRFAIDRLGFKPENIILYGWSIGGYPATWASATYPAIKGTILDASFDDIVPLAVSKMPPSWKPIVVHTVRSYFNLNNSDNLSHYKGPILLIRRLQDEIIHTLETEPIKTNRANYMLIKLLSDRFPNLLKCEEAYWALQDWLSGNHEHQIQVMRQHHVEDGICFATLTSYTEANQANHYPVDIGSELADDMKVKITLYLASKHLIDYDSTHCTPLPKSLFIEPFNLFEFTSTGGQKSSL